MVGKNVTYQIENNDITVTKVPKLKYIGNGTNIMQKARVFSTMMYLKDISRDLPMFHYIYNILKYQKNGAVFQITPTTGKYDAHKYTLFVSVKKSDIMSAEKKIVKHRIMSKAKIKCEVVFVHSYKKVMYGEEKSVLCTDHGSVYQKYKVQNIKLLRYFSDLNNSPNFLREVIYSDIRKIFVDIDFTATINDDDEFSRCAVEGNISEFRDRDALCKHQRVLIDTLNSTDIFLPGIIDIITDMLILAIDYNVWDKKFLLLSPRVTDLYINNADIVDIYPEQLRPCQNLKQITINEDNHSPDIRVLKSIFYIVESLQYINTGNNTYYLKKYTPGGKKYTVVKDIADEEELKLYFQDGYHQKLIPQVAK